MIATGIIFLCGLITLGFWELTTFAKFLHENPEMKWVLFVVTLGGCYLIGTVLQQVSSFVFEKKYSKRIISTILCNQQSVLNNQTKLKVHQEYARKLFQRKRILFSSDIFLEQHCDYYFTYCSYYIQNQNKHHKPEKMRGLRGIYSLLVTCFAVLFVLSLFRIAYGLGRSESIVCLIHIACMYFALFLLYCHAYQENTKFWVRMVLGVYETCVDIDMRNIIK